MSINSAAPAFRHSIVLVKRQETSIGYLSAVELKLGEKKMATVRFELTPPKRLVNTEPETSALDQLGHVTNTNSVSCWPEEYRTGKRRRKKSERPRVRIGNANPKITPPNPSFFNTPSNHFLFLMLSRVALRSSSRLATRAFSTTQARHTKVAVLGAGGGIGQPLSLLLKSDPLVSKLSLYDIRGAPGVAADVGHVDTGSEVCLTTLHNSPFPNKYPLRRSPDILPKSSTMLFRALR